MEKLLETRQGKVERQQPDRNAKTKGPSVSNCKQFSRPGGSGNRILTRGAMDVEHHAGRLVLVQ